ncbi:MAG: glucuronyl hydrolase [Pseudopedobacter saltans]|uniref:Glucuronyl hydrolase n=1 Tax=Pseudopedobacter saltans TaxID=151895 RepID=A0A2W5ETR4_9SPHI|nr:MAG: glucuronyl hydrolase [Pseudopedobacter saltans]
MVNTKLKSVVLLCFSFAVVNHLKSQDKLTKAFIQEQFNFADSQYHVLISNVDGSDEMPQTFNSATNKVVGYERTWWCTGFYPGSLWYIFEETGDSDIRKEAERALDVIKPNEYYTGNHDLGFMMFCSFGNAYRLTKDTSYKNVLFQSAHSLSTRYRPGIPAIQSWNKNKNFNCPVIIDNMMNLELLEWVSKNGGNSRYADIALNHANTTLKNHFRPDYSSYHVIDYDSSTGKVLQKRTWQGYSDSSAWARGQGWALYGYTMMYRFTKKKEYLEQAKHVASFILDNPNLPSDKIPYWDFNDPKIPNVPRDASAGALMSSALLEVGQYTSGKERKKYLDNAVQMIKSLSTATYRSSYGANGGFLLMHSTGALPLKSEIDVPLVYADYYFLEALKRYKDWYL